MLATGTSNVMGASSIGQETGNSGAAAADVTFGIQGPACGAGLLSLDVREDAAAASTDAAVGKKRAAASGFETPTSEPRVEP